LKRLQTENFTNQLAKETSGQLKELNSYVRQIGAAPTNDERQIKIQKERLTNDLVKTLNKFHEVQKLAMQKQRESNDRARANMGAANDDGIKMQSMRSNNNNTNIIDFGDDDEMGSFQNNNNNNSSSKAYMSSPNNYSGNNQQQTQAQVAMESDINMQQLREREQALNKLENDIVDVNMIFKDLAVMVHDQGEIIDSIESNVEAVQMRVTTANTHLESAKVNQV
jgi:predicted AAA+ superfamily ATPase